MGLAFSAGAREVTVFAPASVGNAICGFDILGLCLGAPGDTVAARFADGAPGVRIAAVEGGADTGAEGLPTDAARNTAGVAAQSVLARAGAGQRVELTIRKEMPFGSGLGSSAASAVAAAVAVNALLGGPLAEGSVLEAALDGEALASGGRHADNVAPCLLGGIVLCPPDGGPPVRLPVPARLWAAIVHPHVRVLTADARAALGPTVGLRAHVAQTGHVALVVAGLFADDLALVARGLRDAVVAPQRAHLVPRFPEMQAAALAAGALGCSLSGSGPSVVALCDGGAAARAAADAMQAALGSAATSTAYVGAVSTRGAHVVGTPVASGP